MHTEKQTTNYICTVIITIHSKLLKSHKGNKTIVIASGHKIRGKFFFSFSI